MKTKCKVIDKIDVEINKKTIVFRKDSISIYIDEKEFLEIASLYLKAVEKLKAMNA